MPREIASTGYYPEYHNGKFAPIPSWEDNSGFSAFRYISERTKEEIAEHRRWLREKLKLRKARKAAASRAHYQRNRKKILKKKRQWYKDNQHAIKVRRATHGGRNRQSRGKRRTGK